MSETTAGQAAPKPTYLDLLRHTTTTIVAGLTQEEP